MTDRRRRRWSKRTLRGVAWLAGGAAFAAPFASLTVSPKPAAADARRDPGRVVVVRKIVRRVIVQPAPSSPDVRYVYVDGGGSSSSNGTTGGGTTGSSTTGGSTAAAATAPATTTGGS